MTVSVKAEVAEFDGQKILFNIVAYDEAGIIATGKHERMIVNRKMLFQKTRKSRQVNQHGVDHNKGSLIPFLFDSIFSHFILYNNRTHLFFRHHIMNTDGNFI